jgi:hypothetical protein
MLRRLLMLIVLPPLLAAMGVLIMVGLGDIDLLVAIVSKLMIIAIIIGIPVMAARMILFPGRSQDRRR